MRRGQGLPALLYCRRLWDGTLEADPTDARGRPLLVGVILLARRM